MNQDTTKMDRGSVVAGLFSAADNAEKALSDLKAAGLSRVEISQVSGDSEAAERTARASTAYDVRNEAGAASATVGSVATTPFFQEHDSTATAFVSELVRLGFSMHDAHDLVDGLVKGEALVTADAGTNFEQVTAILRKYDADIRYTTGAMPPTASAAAASVPAAAAVAKTTADADQDIQLRAERLVINKQRIQHGEARVRKEIVTEMKSIDVPVSHEELVIERHAISDDVTTSNAPIADQTIRIPLTEEKVNVSKETFVIEEVEVGRRRVEDVQHISDIVRHEELRVESAPTKTANAARTPQSP
jgi:uncharacterized protein (TIGR02271 family)